MKPYLTILPLLITSICFAQKQNVYFLKDNGRYVDVRDSADYIRVVREPDSASTLYNIFEFYPNSKQKLVGKSSTIDPPNFEGQCITYYVGGSKKSLANYKKGSLVGTLYEFYPNGKPYLLTEYPDNGERDSNFRDFRITANYDSLGTTLVEKGDGHTKMYYNNNFKDIAEEGDVKNGKREGEWKGNFQNIKTTFTETYHDGQLISGSATDGNGKMISYTKSRGTAPEFKGGVEAFGAYLGNNIHYPDYERSKNIEGKVVLSFIVDKDGKVSGVKVNKSVSRGIDAEAARVIQNSPRWVPGTMFGKPVRVSYSVPVNFALR